MVWRTGTQPGTATTGGMQRRRRLAISACDPSQEQPAEPNCTDPRPAEYQQRHATSVRRSQLGCEIVSAVGAHRHTRSHLQQHWELDRRTVVLNGGVDDSVALRLRATSVLFERVLHQGSAPNEHPRSVGQGSRRVAASAHLHNLAQGTQCDEVPARHTQRDRDRRRRTKTHTFNP